MPNINKFITLRNYKIFQILPLSKKLSTPKIVSTGMKYFRQKTSLQYLSLPVPQPGIGMVIT